MNNMRGLSQVSIRLLLYTFQILSLSLVFIFHVQELTPMMIWVALGILVLQFAANVLIVRITRGDPYLLLISTMLFAIGILMIYRIEPALGQRQLMIYAGSLLAFFLVFFFLRKTGDFWENKTLFFYLVTLAFFFLTLVLGRMLGGAKNWVEIFGVQIQPSEFAKIPFAFFVASWYRNYERWQTKVWTRYSLTIGVYVLIGLFFIQKELGTAMVFFAVLLGTQFAFEKHRHYFWINLLLGIVGLWVAYYLFSHIQVRFSIWQNPWKDFDGAGYQIIQSLFAVAEGGFFGTGIGLGQPQRIPLGHSDFIFASIIEEMGAFMGICVVLLFLLLVYRGVKIVLREARDFNGALALIITIMFGTQALIMFAGVLKIIPLTGITIPFMTYGGSSLLSSYVLLSMLQFSSEDGWRNSHGTK